MEFEFLRGKLLFPGPQITLKAEQVKYVDRRKDRKVYLPSGKFKWKSAPFKVKTESHMFEMNPDFSSDEDFDFD